MPQASIGEWMLAEIREQPDALRELCRRAETEWVVPKSLFRGVSQAVLVGSGSSYHAALAARVYLETLAGIATRVDHASESFRYEVPGRPLVVGFSHSGSSSDVRAALRRAKRQGCRTVALTNIDGSPVTRDVDAAWVTGAGVERAVPSTKGFTALVAASLLLASYRAGSLPSSTRAIRRAARMIECLEKRDAVVERVASAKAVVFLGEGLFYPVAKDAALKLLEVSYIPALAYPTEEFRHGPIAVAEAGVVVVALSGGGAGGGASAGGAVTNAVRSAGASMVSMSEKLAVPSMVRPLVRAVETQLLVHGVGVRLGRDVDRPRALSKIVR